MNELPCVIYAAKSTEDIRGSIGTQLEDCRAAIEREGARRVVVEHKDESASAFRGNRGPGLGAAKRALGGSQASTAPLRCGSSIPTG
jgi:hypothetical protein